MKGEKHALVIFIQCCLFVCHGFGLALLVVLTKLLFMVYVRFDKRRRIAIMIGSDSDLKQFENALNFLALMVKNHEPFVKVLRVYTNSIHRNTLITLWRLFWLWLTCVDVIIVAAGWANHLSGVCEAFVRYVLKSRNIMIVPMACDAKNDRKNRAAILSISEVPKHQMEVFPQKDETTVFLSAKSAKYLAQEVGVYFGEDGAVDAVKLACSIDIKPKKLPSRVPPKSRSLIEAITTAHELNEAERRKEEEKGSK